MPILAFIFELGVLNFVHELGHFLAAKWAGIRVERFSLGFPPRMIGKKIGDTDYCISWLPLGGYVKMAGMIDESMDTKIEGKPDEFMSKPIWKRAIVIGAGPAMNLILAFVLFSGLAYHLGVSELLPVVEELLPGSPAESIGLQPGDRITNVGGSPIQTWEELTTIIHASPDKPLPIEWARNGEQLSAVVTPKLDPQQKIGLIGIKPRVTHHDLGFVQSVSTGFMLSWRMTAEVGRVVGRLFSGQESIKEGLAGPLKIMEMAGAFARQGFADLLQFIAFISLQLGLLNLLPIPVLDGGHLLFLGIESVMRRPVSVRTRLIIQQFGMALLLALMVFVIINDIPKVNWSEILPF